MKIHGFTFVRNAIKYDYPVVESIKSILPITDEFIVSVGNSDDDTLKLIASIDSPKIKIVLSTWDDTLREGGQVLAQETDKAFAMVSPDADWAFYLQADEVVHEKYLETIRTAAEKYLSQSEVEGLLFKYLHFYGTYNYIGDSRRWYNREIRMIRNDKSIRSYRDAQGFRKNERKLKVKLIDAYINHYGWVKHPRLQQNKRIVFDTMWKNSPEIIKKNNEQEVFDYLKDADVLTEFKGEHPAVMANRIQTKNWDIILDTSNKNLSFKDYLLHKIEKVSGKRIFDYRNYRLL